MHETAAGEWVSEDGRWVWDPAVDDWVPRDPPPAPAAGSGATGPIGAGRRDLGSEPDPPGGTQLDDALPAGDPDDSSPADLEDLAGADGAGGAARTRRPVPRTVVVAAAVGVLILLAAILSQCTGGGSTGGSAAPTATATRSARPPTPAAATATRATNTARTGFPAAARRAYLSSCVRSQGSRKGFCGCTLTELQRTMSWAEFRRIGQQALNGDTAARQRYTAAILACADRLPSGR